MKKNLEICMSFGHSRSQRKTEIARGEGTEGTISYENKGCYECDGSDKKCTAYISLSRIRNSK